MDRNRLGEALMPREMTDAEVFGAGEMSDAEVFGASPRKAAPRVPQRGQRRDLATEIAGGLAQINRGLGIGDEMAGVFGAIGDIATGKASITDPVGAFRGAMGRQRALEDDFAQRRPLASATLRGTGQAGTLAIPAAPALNTTRAANAVRGAVTAGAYGGAYAAADRGSAGERARAAREVVTSPATFALGAGLGAAGRPAVRAPAKPPPQVTPQQRLAQQGVALTPGQRMAGRGPIGDLAKNAEDLAQRVPILGPTITGARTRANDSVVRSVGLQALAPVGGTIPKGVKPGFEMVQHVDDEIGKVYKQAADLVPRVAPDAQIADDLARIGERKVDLAETEAAQFDRIISDRLTRLQRDGLSGQGVKDMHSELGKLQAEAARKGQSTLSGMLGDTRRALMDLVGRHNPEAQTLIRRAYEAWGLYSIMNDAAASAQARGGVFTPGQLGTQARIAAKSQGANMAGKGMGRLQQFAADAQRVMPDQFGNPGTANAIGLGGGAVGLMTEPMTTLAVGAGLGAAATPYALMGRRVIEQLPPNATSQELQAAALQLAPLAQDPAVAAMYRQVVARLTAASGVAVAGAGASSPQ